MNQNSMTPGKDALMSWMKEASPAIPSERLHLFLNDIKAGEYVMGIEDFMLNVRPIGWTNEHIDLLANQFLRACELVARDPHPEYLSPKRIASWVEEFKDMAGRTSP